MNIVKIKDIKIESGLGGKEEVYEEYFRGKYVIAINWLYCIPMENYNMSQVIEQSKTYVAGQGIPTDAIAYTPLSNAGAIDTTTTDKLNNYDKYIKFNEFVPTEITSADVKRFRTWLAETLNEFDLVEDEKVKQMITYYAEGMHDDTIISLQRFGATTTSTTTTAGCGCTKTEVTTIENCDPITIYRTNIYNLMVTTFSEMSFWQQYETDFLEMFKLYIDNVITMNLPFSEGTTSDLQPCSCEITEDTVQTIAMDRLKKLSTALGYLIAEDITGHKTYIAEAFNGWAKYLYEKMEWV